MQGWISYTYGTMVAAPVVETVKTGTTARFLTLIVPEAGRPNVKVTGFSKSADGFAFTVTIDGRSEKVTVDGSGSAITTP